MKTKEQVIQESYGVDWDKLSDETKESVINQNGNILSYLVSRSEESPYYEMVGNGFARPISLRGIEDNNGWTNIYSEEDFPKEDGEYCIIDKFGNQYISKYDREYKQFFSEDYTFNDYELTHYQKIETPKPPIY